MRLTREQETVCRVFGRRDSTGHVHCAVCPMVLDHKSAACIKTVTKGDAIKFHDWNGSPYPALGEYEGEQQGYDNT